MLGGVVISNSYTAFNVSISRETKEKTAGNESWKSFNRTTKKIEWDIEFYDEAEANDDVMRVINSDDVQTLTGFPKGNVAGKPIFSFNAIIEKSELPVKFDDNVSRKVSGIGTGEPLVPFTAYGSGT